MRRGKCFVNLDLAAFCDTNEESAEMSTTTATKLKRGSGSDQQTRMGTDRQREACEGPEDGRSVRRREERRPAYWTPSAVAYFSLTTGAGARP